MDADLTERVVAFLIDARKSGWEIAFCYVGDLRDRGRYEITVWREPPAKRSASSRPEGAAGKDALDDQNLPGETK